MKYIQVKRWSDSKSIKVKLFGLYFGCSLGKHKAAFIIFNGKRTSWQLQTWSPRWAWRIDSMRPDDYENLR